MKTFLTFIAVLALSSVGLCQDMAAMMKVPDEVQKLDFLVGTWTGKETYHMGPQESSSDVTINCTKELNGRFIHSMEKMNMMGMDASGMSMITYNPDEKTYKGWWFDSMSASAMEVTGNFEGEKLVLVSKPMTGPGMPQPTAMRASWAPKDATHVSFTLEQQVQGSTDWTNVISGEYTKGSAK